MKSNGVFRIRIISACILLFAAMLVGRLYFLQIVYGDTLKEKADRQYAGPNQYVFDRGAIFFKNKEGGLIAAATVRTSYILTIDPTKVTDREALYRILSNVISIDRDAFLLHAGKKGDRYEEIVKQIPEEIAKKINELGLPEVGVYKEQRRFYPGGSFAAQTVGFVAYDESGTALAGRYGLEKFYESVLSRDTNRVYVNFFAQVFTGLGKSLFADSEGGAGDIVTTIEPSVQLFLERTLGEVQDTWHSKQTGGIIIDPITGAIYALALQPSYDLNSFQEQSDSGIYTNALVEGVYEMGSIIKPLTMAAGLDAGVVTATTTYDDKGFLELDGKRISNYDGVARGVVPLQEFLNQSLNTGAAFVAGRLGHERMRKYFTAYGFGEETGIDLPNEVHGLIDNLKSPRDIEYATASFGQGIALTPIETVRALATLGNGGVLVTPHIVERIKYETGVSKTVGYHDGERVLKAETSEEITRMLVEVVDKALVGGAVSLPHYSIAAKTGTAQIAEASSRGYYSDRYLHSFFGYFPAYDPRFLVFLFTIEPQGVKYASQTLVTPFMNTAKFLINYYDIPPDR